MAGNPDDRPPKPPESDPPPSEPPPEGDATLAFDDTALSRFDAAVLAALRSPNPQPDSSQPHFEKIMQQFRQGPEGGASSAAQPQTGERIRYMGDYELLEQLGRGGMGVVYRARQLTLQREVAVKLLLGATHAAPELRERFRREAEAVAGLDHPHIIPVYEIGEHQGQNFFSMKLVPGFNLSQSLGDWTCARECTPAERRRRERAVAQLLEKIAAAIHHAHQHGVLHRDLKPSNVLLDAESEPYVTDFGLAKHLDGQLGLTATGAVLGTPAYMAPEQAAGKKDISTAADVYGLGAILYELLTARAPYKGDSSAEILRLVIDTDPAEPRALQPHLDRDLETICLKCLRKDPSERYASAAELVAELQRFSRSEPILARPITTRERLLKWARRKPATAALAIVSAAGLLALIVGLLIGNQLIRTEQQKTQAALLDRTAALDREERGSYIKTIALAYRDVRENDIQHAYHLLQTCPPERREWEWHYLMRRCQGDYRELETGGAVVRALAFSPDGKYLAVVTQPTVKSVRPQLVIRVWQVEKNYDPLHTLRPTDIVGEVNQVWRCRLAFTPDSAQLLMTGFRADQPSTGLVKRWNVIAGQEVPSAAAFANRQVFDLPVHPDGSIHALTAPLEPGTTGNMQFELVDLQTGLVRHTLEVPAGTAPANGRYLDANRFVLAHTDFSLIDLPSGKQTWRHGSRSSCTVAVSPDQKFAAAVSEFGNISVVDVATGEKKYERPAHRNAAEGVVFHPAEPLLASLGYDGVIRVANISDGSEVRRLVGLRESPFSLTFDPAGKFIVTDGLPNGRIAIWRWKGEPQLKDLGAISELSVHGKSVAVAEQQGEVSVWDAESWTRVRKIPAENRLPTLNTAAIDPTGKYLATGDGHFREPGAPGTVTLWDFATGEKLHTFPAAKEFVFRLRFSPDGKQLAWAGGNRLVLSDVAQRKEIWSLPLQDKYATFAFRPVHPEIVISDAQYQATRPALYFVDSRTGKELRNVDSPFSEGATPVYGTPDFSADGRWLLAGGSDGGTARFQLLRWDADRGTVVQKYTGGSMLPGMPVMSPNGRRIFAPFWDGSVTVWDTETGAEMLHIVDAEHQLYDLKLLPTGVLVAGGFEGTLYRWDGRPVEQATLDRK